MVRHLDASKAPRNHRLSRVSERVRARLVRDGAALERPSARPGGPRRCAPVYSVWRELPGHRGSAATPLDAVARSDARALSRVLRGASRVPPRSRRRGPRARRHARELHAPASGPPPAGTGVRPSVAREPGAQPGAGAARRKAARPARARRRLRFRPAHVRRERARGRGRRHRPLRRRRPRIRAHATTAELPRRASEHLRPAAARECIRPGVVLRGLASHARPVRGLSRDRSVRAAGWGSRPHMGLRLHRHGAQLPPLAHAGAAPPDPASLRPRARRARRPSPGRSPPSTGSRSVS